MPHEGYNLRLDSELPPVKGPKLQAFKYRNEPVVFLELLSSPPEDDRANKSSRGHGHVFRVQIRGEEYALKVFKFFPIRVLRKENFPAHNGSVDATQMSYQSDPFFAECRAYGRINELLEGQRRSGARSQEVRPDTLKQSHTTGLAVPCYGFMGLPSVPYEKFFLTDYAIDDWNRGKADLQLPTKRRPPFRAIVKKLMPDNMPIRNPVQMGRDLRFLQKQGVVQHDVFLRNYMDGLLVDFSVAWTEPHWVKDVLPRASWEHRKQADFQDFDDMMEEAGVKLRSPLARSLDTYARLRRLPDRADIQAYCTAVEFTALD